MNKQCYNISNGVKKNKTIYLIAGLIIIIAVALILSSGNGTPKPAANIDPNNLAGIQKGSAPWLPELNYLKDRLAAIGLPALSEEGSALHIHQHLDIFIDGKPVSVPAGIGINEKSGFISPVHTHDPDAIIHVESPIIRTFTLGQFFDIWGVRFADQCLGGYCNDGTKTLKVYVNGNLISGDPRQIKLEERQEIVVTYGTDKDLSSPIPSSFIFPPDL